MVLFYIEDNEEFRKEIIHKYFPKDTVFTFSEGEKFIEFYEKSQQDGSKPNFIICDYELEGKATGVEVIEKIRDYDKQTFILAFGTTKTENTKLVKAGANIGILKDDYTYMTTVLLELAGIINK